MQQKNMLVCQVCGNHENNQIYLVREMMYGFRDEFEYYECSICGCLQIKDIPNNLEKYYPKNYYSYETPGGLKSYLKHTIAHNRLYHKNNLIGILLGKKYYSVAGAWCDWFEKIGIIEKNAIHFNTKILDIGSGNGGFLLMLRKEGFTNLTGVDPYIAQDIIYPNGVRIYKKEINQIQDNYDLITINHAFEHMTAPRNVMENLYRLVKNKGYVLIRIPLAGSFAWKKYRTNWVQLDAPRHLFLHTVKSIKILAESVGFIVKEINFESNEFQFIGSELYLKDISLISSKSSFKEKIERFKLNLKTKFYQTKAIELNRKQEGDAAGFFLYKK